MKIFLDTNLLLRFFLKDVQAQFQNVKRLISVIEEGQFQAYISATVFLEISYVLKSVYKLPFTEILTILDAILSIRGLTIIEQTNTKKAVEFYRKYKIKFTDCLIASQLKRNMILVSFDEELAKIKEITVRKPQEILTKES